MSLNSRRLSDEASPLAPPRIARMLIAAMLLAGATVTLGACNTTAGAGQDITNTGHAITGAAEKAKP